MDVESRSSYSRLLGEAEARCSRRRANEEVPAGVRALNKRIIMCVRLLLIIISKGKRFTKFGEGLIRPTVVVVDPRSTTHDPRITNYRVCVVACHAIELNLSQRL